MCGSGSSDVLRAVWVHVFQFYKICAQTDVGLGNLIALHRVALVLQVNCRLIRGADH